MHGSLLVLCTCLLKEAMDYYNWILTHRRIEVAYIFSKVCLDSHLIFFLKTMITQKFGTRNYMFVALSSLNLLLLQRVCVSHATRLSDLASTCT